CVQAVPAPPPRPGRVRCAVLRDHPGPPAGRDPRPMNRRIPLQPSEGWLTLALVMVLALTVAWSLDAAHLVPGVGDLTSYLPIAAVLGVLCGFIGPKVGWGRWTTYLVGVTFAALIVPLLVGNVLAPRDLTDVGLPGDLFARTARATVNAYTDLIIRNRLTTGEV